MRRVQRGRRGLHRDRLGIRRVGLRLRDVSVLDHRGEHVGASRLRRIGVLDRVVRRRRLRQPREQRHLTQRELVQVGDAEVGLRSGADAVRLIAVEDLVQVHLEDLLLAESARRLEREDRFLDLSRDRRLVAEEARLDELLRDRRAALLRPAIHVHAGRADDAADVDARVGPERLVLDVGRGGLHLLGTSPSVISSRRSSSSV